jgi:hypothetical protein
LIFYFNKYYKIKKYKWKVFFMLFLLLWSFKKLILIFLIWVGFFNLLWNLQITISQRQPIYMIDKENHLFFKIIFKEKLKLIKELYLLGIQVYFQTIVLISLVLMDLKIYNVHKVHKKYREIYTKLLVFHKIL